MLKQTDQAKKIALKSVLFVLLVTIFPACGFYLQQPFAAPQDSQPILVTGDLQLARQVRRELAANNIAVTRQRSQANSVISLTHYNESAREYSLTVDGRKAETQRLLSATVEWQYTNKSGKQQSERVLLAARNITVDAVQINNPDSQAANQREAELIKDGLVKQLAGRILNALHYR